MLPLLVSPMLIKVLYGMVLNGGTTYDADWVPVSIALAAVSGLGLFQCGYNFILGKQLIAKT